MAKKFDRYSASLSELTWHRLKKNRLAMFGFIIIGFCVFISITSYFIIPDVSENGDTQILEIENKPPGFKVMLLLDKRNELYEGVNIFEQLWGGKPSEYERPAPIYEYHFEGNNIVYETYTGADPNKGVIVKKNLADIVYALDLKKPFVNDTLNAKMEFYEIGNNEKILKTAEELVKEVESNNVVNRLYVFGTDKLGRDLLSRLMLGTRISLSVGLISVIISIFIGIFMGALAGFFRGWVDDVIMWMINVVWSIPTLLLVIAITLALGKGLFQVFIAVGLTMWVDTARVVRGQALSLREKEFVEAGRALGFTNLRIIFRHILPNVMGPVIVISAANFANAILIEAGLSYLGIGAQPPIPSWGAMISEHRQYIFSDSAYLAVVPGVAIMIVVLAFMSVGNGLRDALDSKALDDEQAMGY